MIVLETLVDYKCEVVNYLLIKLLVYCIHQLTLLYTFNANYFVHTMMHTLQETRKGSRHCMSGFKTT